MSHPPSNNNRIYTSAQDATMSAPAGPVSPRRPSVEFQHFHPAPPQRAASAASRRSRPVSVHSHAQQAQHHPNSTPDDPDFPPAAFHTEDGTPLFTRQQVQAEVDRQSWEYRRDADRLGGEYQRLKIKITSLEAEVEKGSDGVNAREDAAKGNRDAQDTLAAATVREVTLRAQLERANTQLEQKTAQLQTKGRLYGPQINCLQTGSQAVNGEGADMFDQQWAEKETRYKEEVKRLQHQLTRMQAHYEGQAAREAQPTPKGDAGVSSLRAQVAKLKEDAATAKHETNHMRLEFEQQLLEKDTEIGRLEDYEKAYRRAKASHANQLVAKDEEIATFKAAKVQLPSAWPQQLSQQLAARDNEVAILKEANAQLEEEKRQADLQYRSALTSKKAIRADEQRRSQNSIRSLQKGLTKADDKITSLQTDLTKAEHTTKFKEHHIEVQDGAMLQLKDAQAERMNQAEEEVGVSQEQLIVKTQKLNTTQRELEVTKQQLKRLGGKNPKSPEDQGLDEKLAAMEAKLRKSEKDWRKMVIIKDGETAEIVKLNGELAEAPKTVSELRTEIKELRDDLNVLQDELESEKRISGGKVKSLENKLKRAKDEVDEERTTKRVKTEVKSEKTEPKD